jgi:hypothetical protein
MRWVTVCCALVLALRVARAQPTHDKAAAQKAYAEGQASYNAGDFRTAAQEFELAYDKDPDPVYLFNVAQAYRFGKQCRAAAESYKRFLDAAPTAPNKDKVQHFIAEMETCARAQAEPKPVAEPEPAEGGEHRTPISWNDIIVGPRRSSHTAAYVVGGAGLVALAVGVYFTKDVLDVKDQQRQCAGVCDGARFASLDSEGSRDNIGQILSYTAAAAGLGVAAWLYFRPAGDEHAVALVPTRGGAYASAGFRF